MIFNGETLAKIEDALTSKENKKPCSFCGSNDSVIVDELILMKKAKGGNFPVIVTGCGNCGKTDTFAANTLVPGLLPGGKEENF